MRNQQDDLEISFDEGKLEIAKDLSKLFGGFLDKFGDMFGNFGLSSNNLPEVSGASNQTNNQTTAVDTKNGFTHVSQLLERIAGLIEKITGTSLSKTPNENTIVSSRTNIQANTTTTNNKEPITDLAVGTEEPKFSQLFAGLAEKVGLQLSKVAGGASAVGATGVSNQISDVAGMAMNAGRAAAGDPTAIVGLATTAIKKVQESIAAFVENASKVFEYGGKAMSSSKFEDIGVNLSKTGESFYKMLGPVGKVGEAFFVVTRKIFETIGAFRRWTDQLLETGFQFAEFSSSMANVQAQHDVRKALLSQERGERLAPATSYLQKNSFEFDQDIAWFEDIWTNFTTVLAGDLKLIYKEVKKLVDKQDTPAMDPNNVTLNEWIKGIADEQWDQAYGRPMRHK